MKFFRALIVATSLVGFNAIAKTGPVQEACKADIEKLCPGKSHVRREIRTCLEEKKAEVSEACKAALDSTGPGKGMGMGQGQGMQAGKK